MKKGILILITILYSLTSFSQTVEKQGDSFFKDRFYRSIGFAALGIMDLGYSSCQRISVSEWDSKTSTNINIEKDVRLNWLSFLSIIYQPRYNFYERDEYNSFSINLPFTASFGVNQIGTKQFNKSIYDKADESSTEAFRFNIPLYIQYNHNLGATVDANDEERGFTFGVGIDNHFPLLFIEEGNNLPKQSYWYNPALVFGYRHWGLGENMTEWNFKIGFNVLTSNTADEFYIPTAFTLSYHVYSKSK